MGKPKADLPHDVNALRCELALKHLKAISFAGDVAALNLDADEPGPLRGKRVVEAALAAGKAPDAVFCFTDDMAWGCVQALTEAGMRPGEDVAVVGFDDEPVSAYMTPALTTVHIPARDMGRDAARLMLDLIEGRRKEAAKITLPTKLMERKTGRLSFR